MIITNTLKELQGQFKVHHSWVSNNTSGRPPHQLEDPAGGGRECHIGEIATGDTRRWRSPPKTHVASQILPPIPHLDRGTRLFQSTFRSNSLRLIYLSSSSYPSSLLQTTQTHIKWLSTKSQTSPSPPSVERRSSSPSERCQDSCTCERSTPRSSLSRVPESLVVSTCKPYLSASIARADSIHLQDHPDRCLDRDPHRSRCSGHLVFV